MSKSKCVPLFDGSARTVLRHVKRAEALEMVGMGDAFVLAANPLEIALTRKPPRKEMDGRPDLSLTMPPGVLLAAAVGSKRSREAIESCRTIQMRFKKNPADKDEIAKTHSFSVSQSPIPEELQLAPSEPNEGAILYFPNEGKLTSKGKNVQPIESLESSIEGN